MPTRRILTCLGLLALLFAAPAAYAALGEGADLEIGGPGAGHGKFRVIADITFDDQGNLVVLDGAERGKDGALAGNLLVQKFDKAGRFLAQFSLADANLAERNQPARIAVDAQGRVYVTFPDASLVREYSPEGAATHDLKIPRAFAIAIRKLDGAEQAVVISRGQKGGEVVTAASVFTPGAAQVGRPLALGEPIADCDDIEADSRGNLLVLAAVRRLYKFDPAGKLVATVGGGTRLQAEDGSELLHTVAADSRGNIYSITPGNPGKVSMFDWALKTVTQHVGQHAWNDPYGPASSYTPMAVDPSDRLWIATNGSSDGAGSMHFRPCVLRTKANFLDPETNQAVVSSTLLLGLNLAVESALPYNIAAGVAPISADFVVKAGVRRVKAIGVTWNAYDIMKAEVGKGQFDLALEDSKEARKTVTFTPTRLGWYMLEFHVASGAEPLAGVAAFFGITRYFAGIPTLDAKESAGGWDDPARQAFAGLMCMRVSPKADNMPQVDAAVLGAAKYGCTVLAQFTGKEQCTPEHLRWVLTKFKGRIKYYEILNEPNLTMKPAEYAHLLKTLYPLIKGLDPDAQVLAPATCGLQLPWIEAFYKANGNKFFDILSVHDYEGHESVDPVHWQWKFGELRSLMALHGDEAKALWQTERAITGIRGRTFLGPCQAARVTLHLDLLQSLGIPPEHNLHYYLNDNGYADCPSFLWSKAGPHPAALATRFRYGMTLKRTCTGTLDFGPTGNKLLLGLAYKGDDGTTLILRTLGTQPFPVEFALKGTPTYLDCYDAFGNAVTASAKDGKFTVTASNLPVYLRLAKTQEATPVPINFGENLAAGAQVAYSDLTTSPPITLTNNIIEVVHAGNPHGGTEKPPIWTGEFSKSPQTLTLTLTSPREIGGLVVYGVRADNQFSALLDYDLEYHNGTDWAPLQKVRAHCPPSDAVQTPLCVAAGWCLDPCIFVHQFPTVKTDRLRLVVQRTTIGFLPDAVAQKAWGSKMEPHLQLREIEIYGPAASPPPPTPAKTPAKAPDKAPVKPPDPAPAKPAPKG